MSTDFKNIIKLYSELKAERDKYAGTWNKICKYAGIKSVLRKTVEIGAEETPADDDFDKYTYDPTAALSIQQSADYTKGIIWGNGDNVITLEPSDDVLELIDIDAVKDWFSYATKQVLEQMNHPKAGLDSALAEYFYDQRCIGTSGVGVFPAGDFKKGLSDNALIFRGYGVDTMCIDEGKNGLVEVVFNTYHWRINRIIAEFCVNTKDGTFDKEMFNKLPDKMKEAWNNKNMNDSFKIIHGVIPYDLYTPGAIGKRGCKYIGYWFADGFDKPFYEENYKEKPICVGREEKIRGEVYGRSSGTMLLSSIRCINETMSGVMRTLDKMVEPPIGILSGALFGDNVVDTSARGLTIFNAEKLAGTNPVFPMQDVYDPANLINFLLSYLNEKVSAAFKIDILLDFNAKAKMSATESLQRFAIRARSLSGIIVRHKTEMLEPLIQRCISILYDNNCLGILPSDRERAERAHQNGRDNRIIPDAVLECIKSGKSWYKIRYNNDIEKLTRVEIYEDLIKEINTITALLSINPELSGAINWHKLIADTSNSLGFKDLIVSEQTFKEQQQAQQAMLAQALQAQMQQVQSQTNRNNAGALKEVAQFGQQQAL